ILRPFFKCLRASQNVQNKISRLQLLAHRDDLFICESRLHLSVLLADELYTHLEEFLRAPVRKNTRLNS
ncbi:MAG: hypothetical protein WA822_14745, partial [Albidovulum sp.]